VASYAGGRRQTTTDFVPTSSRRRSSMPSPPATCYGASWPLFGYAMTQGEGSIVHQVIETSSHVFFA
jgi:hypothetical protein